LIIAREVSLGGLGLGSVTPRIASTRDGGVAVVYVRTDGDPTQVVLERLDRTLVPVGTAEIVARDSFSWTEVADSEEGPVVAYALGDGASAILSIDRGGERGRVMLEHPSVFVPLRRGFFWASFEMRADNALVMAGVDPSGAFRFDPVRIELGRYGSGHHAVPRADGTGVVLGYPREDGRGIRHGFVRAVDEAGGLGPEHLISDEDITQVWPLRDDEAGTLIVVSNGDSRRVEQLDWSTLESLTQVSTPPIEGPFVAAMVRGHLVIARLGDSRLEADVYDEGLSIIDTLEVAMPGSFAVGASVAQVPDAMVLVAGLSNGETFPWLARIECAD
jgi:hypothetical protein